MIPKYNKLKAALAIQDMELNEWCEQINVSRSTVRRYFKDERERKNYYLDKKLDELWEESLVVIEEHKQQIATRQRIKRMRT